MLIADTHVHIYPFYRKPLVFQNAFTNLLSAAALVPGRESTLALLLTESHDCHYFDELSRSLCIEGAPEFQISECPEAATLCVTNPQGLTLYVFAGRQINSAEGLEVLALASSGTCPDGLSLQEVLSRVTTSGAVPVIPWSPGKWWFRRGKILANLLRSSHAGDFLLGDSTLRPRGYPKPEIMQLAEDLGFRFVAGSDPLPFRGEEGIVGTYASNFHCTFDATHPLTSIRAALKLGGTSVGRRSPIPTLMRRLLHNYLS